MNDILPEEQFTTPKSDYDNSSLKMGIVSLLMVPTAIYFFYLQAELFGMAFLFGAPILAIFGLVFLNIYKKDFMLFSVEQLKKFKIAKVVCIVSLCISLLTIGFGVLLIIALQKIT